MKKYDIGFSCKNIYYEFQLHFRNEIEEVKLICHGIREPLRKSSDDIQRKSDTR